MAFEKTGLGAYGEWTDVKKTEVGTPGESTSGKSPIGNAHFYMTKGHPINGRYKNKNMEDTIAHKNNVQNVSDAVLQKTFTEMEFRHGDIDQGSTATICAIQPTSSNPGQTQVKIAHVGDSPAFYIKKNTQGRWEVNLLNTLHEEPLSRPEGGRLAMNRSIGDRRYDGVGRQSTPDLKTYTLDSDGFILLCSDGLTESKKWQSSSKTDLEYFTALLNSDEIRNLNPDELPAALAEKALGDKSTDNVSTLIMDLKTAQVGAVFDGHGGDQVSHGLGKDFISALEANILNPEQGPEESEFYNDWNTLIQAANNYLDITILNTLKLHQAEANLEELPDLNNFPPDKLNSIRENYQLIRTLLKNKKTEINAKDIVAEKSLVAITAAVSIKELQIQKENEHKEMIKKIEEENLKKPPSPDGNKIKVEVTAGDLNAKAGVPDDAKKPDPITGKLFHLLTPKAIQVYKNLGFTVENKEDEKGQKYLTLTKDGRSHDVHQWYMTTKTPEGELSDDTKQNLKNMADSIMAVMKEAGKPPYVWVECANPKSQEFLEAYYKANKFTLVKKPQHIDLPRPTPTEKKEADDSKENLNENTPRIKPVGRNSL